MNRYDSTNKQLIFDLDGTLLNHKTSAELAFECCFSHWLPDRDIADEHKQYWFYLEEKYMREFLDGKLSFRDQRKQRIKDFILKYSQRVIIDNLDGLETQYLEYYERNWIAYPEVIQSFLDLLPHVKLRAWFFSLPHGFLRGCFGEGFESFCW